MLPHGRDCTVAAYLKKFHFPTVAAFGAPAAYRSRGLGNGARKGGENMDRADTRLSAPTGPRRRPLTPTFPRFAREVFPRSRRSHKIASRADFFLFFRAFSCFFFLILRVTRGIRNEHSYILREVFLTKLPFSLAIMPLSFR